MDLPKLSYRSDGKIVLDIGKSYTKYGLSGESTPRGIIRSTTIDEMLSLIKRRFCYSNFINKKVILLENSMLSLKRKKELLEKLLIECQCESLTFIPSSLAAMIAVGYSTGLVIDIGYEESTIVPVYDFTPLLHYQEVCSSGVKSVDLDLKRLLDEASIDLDDDLESLRAQIWCAPLNALSDFNVKKDGHIVTVPGLIRSQCVELLIESLSISVLKAIEKVPIDLRTDLIQNIHLIGGGALIPGLKAYMLQRLSEYCDLETRFAPFKRLISRAAFKKNAFLPPITGWVGASMAGASNLVFKEIGKEEFIKLGSTKPVTSDTPGPNVYDTDVKADNHKHYGFLEKSDRFKKPTKGDKTNITDDFARESKAALASEDIRKPNEPNDKQIARLKKEIAKLRETIERQNAVHDRELSQLNEKYSKLESYNQNILKEKNSLSFTLISKEKEIAKLLYVQSALSQRVEKTTASLLTKRENNVLLEKKLHSLEKVKDLTHKELQAVVQELHDLRDREGDFQQKLKELMDQLDQKNTLLLESKENQREMKKRILSFEDKLKLQSQEFQSSLESLKSDNVNQSQSFTGQKQALLERITSLESDLEILQRSVFSKDEELEKSNNLLLNARESADGLKTQVSNLEATIVELKRDKEATVSTFSKEQRDLQQLLEQKLKQKSVEFESIASKYHTLQQTLREMESFAENDKARLMQLTQSYNSKLADYEDLTHQMETKIKTLTRTLEAEKENSALLSSNHRDMEQNMIQKFSKLTEELTSLKIELNETNSAKDCILADLAACRKALDTEQGKNDHLTKSLEEAKSKMDNLNRKIIQAQNESTQSEEAHKSELNRIIKNFEAEKNELTEQLLKRTEEHGRVNTSLETLTIENKKKITFLQEENSKLHSQVAELSSTLDLKLQDLQQAQFNIANANENRGLLEAETKRLNSKLAQVQDTNLSLEDQLNDMSKEMQKTILRKEKEIENLTHSLEESSERVESLNRSISEAQKKLNQAEELHERKLSLLTKNYEDEKKLLAGQVSKQQEEFEQVKNSLETLTIESKHTIISLQQDNSILQSQVAELSATLDRKDLDLKQAQTNIANADENMKLLETEIEKLKSNLQDANLSLKTQLTAKSTELQQLTDSTSLERERFEHSIATLKNANKEISEEFTNFKKAGEIEFKGWKMKMVELNQRLTESTLVHEREVAFLKESLANENARIQILQNELEDARSTIERSELKMTNEITSRQLKIKTLEGQLKEEEKKVERVSTELEHCQSAFSVEKSKTESLTKALEEAEDRVQKLNRSISIADADLIQCKEDHQTELNRLNKSFEGEKNMLTEQLSKQKEEFEIMKATLEDLTIENKQKITFLQEENSKLHSQVAELSSTLDLKLQDLQQAQMNIANAIENRGLLEAETKRLNSKLTQVQDTNLSLEEQLNEMSKEMQKTILRKEKEIENLTHSLEESSERVESLNRSISEAQKKLNQAEELHERKLSLLTKNYEDEKKLLAGQVSKQQEEFEQVKNSLETLTIESKHTIISLQQDNSILQSQVAELSATLDLKDLDLKQAQTNIANAEENMKLLETEIEKLNSNLANIQDANLSLKTQLTAKSTEMQQLTDSTLVEREKLNEKIDILKNANKDISEELSSFRKAGKAEFNNWKMKMVELNQRITESNAAHEREVAFLKESLVNENARIQILQNELEDARSTIERSELKMTNEITSRQLKIKTLEGQLKEEKKHHESLKSTMKSLEHKLEEEEAHRQSIISKQVEIAVSEAQKQWDEDKNSLESAIVHLEQREQESVEKLDKLMLLLEEAKDSQSKERELYQSQLQLLEERGQLQKGEIAKISELNAEIFGHANSRQKIKHVANLKAENMTLKEQKLLNTERELEASKSFDKLAKKTSKVSRNVLENFKNNRSDGEKENQPDDSRIGGINSLSLSLRVSILTLICVLAFSSRLFSVLRFESIIHEFDPWFNYRTTVELVEQGFYDFVNWFDELSWYPLGRVVGGTVYPGIIVTAGAIHWLLNFLNIPTHIREVCVFFAPIFSMFTAIATYFLTSELKNTSAGLFAAAFIGIAPGYISRSVAGSFDNEGIAIFLLVLTFYFWIKALKEGSSLYSTLTAMFYYYMVTAWGGYVFIINMIPVHVFTLLLMGRFSTRIYVAYSTFYITGTIASMTVPFVGFLPMRTSEHMAAFGVFGLVQIVAFTEMLKSHLSAKEFKTLLFGLVVGVASVGFAALVIMTRAGYIAPFTGRFYSLWDTGYAKIHIPIIASVSEHQPTAWTSFFFDLNLLIAIFPAGIYFCFRELKDEHVFVILYGIFASYFAGVMVRLLLTLTPVVCVAAGISFTTLLESYIPPQKEDESIESKKTNSEIKDAANSIQGSFKYVLTIPILVVLILFSWHCTYVTSTAYSSPSVVLASQNRDGSTHIIDDFREAYFWLRQNTHEKAKILSWWDYGYQITGMSNRTVLVDNNTWNNTHIATVGKVLASSEEQAYEVMKKLDVDYLLVIFGGLIGYSGDDLNKFLWMIRIGQGVFPNDVSERKFFTDRGEYALGKSATPTMKNSLMYKMSYYRFNEFFGGGPARDNVRGEEIPADPITLTTIDEAYSTENLIVRIYQVKKPDNLGRPFSVASSFGKKRRKVGNKK